MPKSGALANIDAHHILQRYAQGELIYDIARELGVAPASVYRDLIRDCPDEWQAAQAADALAAYTEAKLNLDTLPASAGPVACNLAQARVKVRQWELERLLKRLYGPQMAITGADSGPLQVQIVRFSERLVGDVVGDAPVDAEIVKDIKQLSTK